MKYINFSKSEQLEFMTKIKQEINESWDSIAKKLEINRSMIFFYRNGHSKISQINYEKLCKLANIKESINLKFIEINNKKNTIKIPKLTETLSEFIGSLAGDGHINNINYEVSISMDKNVDSDYSNHTQLLFKKLFNLKAKKHTQKNSTKCYVYSKELVEFLSEKYKIPIGKKKEKLKIPLKIKKNNLLLKAYIRGVFDTDGSFHRHRPKDAMLGISSRDESFLNEIEESLKKLKFPTYRKLKDVYIYNKKEIDRFFKEIKPSNRKHTKKYNFYLKNGFVPLHKDILKR
ncbi:hypothetical protein C0585_01145 [Candidatus Woesearchaeota archaeon]|nr:MAG: hypothetical protein C0585_01145 [Candidatus Woesearchaeota archaeon]